MSAARSLDDQLKCVRREIKVRERVYPRLIDSGRMSEAFAAEQIHMMKMVAETLEKLINADRLI